MAEKLAKKEAEQAVGEEVKVKAEEVKKAEVADYAATCMEEGIALSKLGRDGEALEAFVKAVELDPENAVAWRKKGTALGKLGRDEEALEAFVRAIELDPKDVAAWSNKVTALIRLGRDDEVKEAKVAEKLAKKEAELGAKERLKREAEEARRKARETEKLAKKEAELGAKERLKREAEEARKAREAEKLAKKEAEQAARESARRKAEEARKAKEASKAGYDIGSELYEGDVQLAIKPLVSYMQINEFRKNLRTVENLRIISDSWSEDEGNIIVVSLQEPMALARVLREMPTVEKLYREGKNIVVALKTSAEAG